METTTYKVQIELTEDLLGTIPKNKDVFAKWIASKAPTLEATEEEIATAPDMAALEARGWTGFHEEDGKPLIYSNMVKANMCEGARVLKQFGVVKQLQDKFKRFVFIRERKIHLPSLAEMPLERPLRAMTAQGPRTTVVRSDVVKAGAKLDFTVDVIEGGGVTRNCLAEVLSYGQYLGLGQWRTGGYGTFKVVSLEEV